MRQVRPALQGRGDDDAPGHRDDGDYQARREREERESALALRYRSGDHAALGDLYRELRPLIHGFLQPYLSGSRPLPLGMEPEDLYQQAYVALAEAALEWQPERRDSFVPYFLRSFPGRIDHYLYLQTPSRRTARFRLLSVPHDLLMKHAARTPGQDGRDWDDALGWAELVSDLPRLCGQVVHLHLYRGLSFADIGASLGIGRSTAHEAFGRAIALLKASLAASQPSSGEPALGHDAEVGRPANGHQEVDRAALCRCVEAMHRLAPRGSALPGGRKLCQAAGLTQQEHREIMLRLRAAGCVAGRRRGSAGSLACATAAETMRKLVRRHY